VTNARINVDESLEVNTHRPANDLNRHLTLMQIRNDAVCHLCQEDEETVFTC